MTRLQRIGTVVILSAMGIAWASAQRPGDIDIRSARKEREWSVKDLPRHPSTGTILPISNEVIFENSCEALRRTPEDQELKRRTLELALALAQPQPPSHQAWQFLIDQGALKDGMPLREATMLLGRPTYQKNGELRWYFNFRNYLAI